MGLPYFQVGVFLLALSGEQLVGYCLQAERRALDSATPQVSAHLKKRNMRVRFFVERFRVRPGLGLPKGKNRFG